MNARSTWQPLRLVLAGIAAFALAGATEAAELILHGGKIVTVDRDFTIVEALAVADGKIVRTGTSDEVLKLATPQTRVVDLKGRMVLPGLIDSHVHATGASMTEFDHEIPVMESIGDVLAYIKSRAETLEEGQWIVVRQVFITRLREQRWPTRAELDAVAPKHPVMFSTGPDASVNSLALQLSGIDKEFRESAGGLVERDPATGEPTGILRSAGKYVKAQTTSRSSTPAERDERLLKLFADYNANGITTVVDRSTSSGAVEQYHRLAAEGRSTVRTMLTHGISNTDPAEKTVAKIREIAAHPLCRGTPMVRIIGVKAFLDGGMLTGSAYMRDPWGTSAIYSIDDPSYRGLLYIEHENLVPLVRAAVENNLQFTAHSVGDGAVHALLAAYEEVNRDLPVAPSRPCITHSNFMSREAVEQAARLGVVHDIQPAWLWLDTRTLVVQFGYDRLRYFQPLSTIFAAGGVAGGGSDHMQKIGPRRSVNPYDPFLGMWVTITRRANGYDQPLHPEEALTREQAIRFYTANNAYVARMEDQLGSLEPGKQADLIIVDRDQLTCPVDEIRDTRVLATYLGGKRVYEAQ